ncbi:MAG: HlyD family efflux transporter periplasmic adaptor subunit [Pseudomonadota bacterium]
MDSLPPDEPRWRALGNATDMPGAASAWLALQSDHLGDVIDAVVVIREADGMLTRVASVPERGSTPQALRDLLERAVAERAGQVNAGGECTDAAAPLLWAGELIGAVAFRLRRRGEASHSLVRELRWGSGWLLARLVQLSADGYRRRSEEAAEVAETLAAVHAADSMSDSARSLATRLAARLRCDRVSVGRYLRGRSRLQVVSHMAIEPKRMNLVRSIEQLMDETIDQGTSVLAPAAIEEVPPLIRREHQRHLREHDVDTALTVVLPNGAGDEPPWGALCLERGADTPFTPEESEAVERIALLSGPVLAVRERDERWIGSKLGAACVHQLQRLIGPGHLGLKASMLMLTMLIAAAWWVRGDFRVTADARLQGQITRTVAAPIDGFLREAPVRAGDRVNRGDLLGQLDERDLRLERLAQTSRRSQLALQLQDAQARGERAEASVLAAQIEQVEAEVALLDEQISRMRIAAPFDGLVISGDLTQSLGASVARGQVLFEITPLEGYRVQIDVDDKDIEHLAIGQQGELVLASLPNQRFDIEVVRLTPSSKAQDGRNVFTVEAQVTANDERLRPGMAGIAKVSIGERRVVWLWSRTFIDWLALTYWRLAP